MTELGESGVAALVGPEEAPAIFKARERTAERLEEKRARLGELQLDEDASVVLMGSWGRSELTSESDDDFMVLFNGDRRDDAAPSIDQVSEVFGQGEAAPGPEGIFGKQVWLGDLKDHLGPIDTNENLTRRMLLILESVSGAGAENHRRAQSALLSSYLGANAKEFQPPRYFLNDAVRYWRTIAVDFEAKHRDRGGEGWGLRNAKLRFSRKALFAGGLFPLLRCSDLRADEMPDFLAAQFRDVPLDRLANAFVDRGLRDPGIRALIAYNEFLEILDNPEYRRTLKSLDAEHADDSELFVHVRELGQAFQAALLSLLFDDEEMVKLVREFLVF